MNGTFPSMPTACPEQGWYPGIAETEYRRWRAWNQSILKLFGEWDNDTMPPRVVPAPFKTPAHAFAALNEPEDPTPAQAFGTAFHRLLLEPARFASTYHALKEPIDRRTKDGRAEWKQLAEQYGESNILQPEEWDTLQKMAAAAAADRLVRDIIGAEGDCEVSITWRDISSGEMCKGRIDKRVIATSGKHILIDPKTTRCPHWRIFEKDAASYGYHIQAAMYVDGYEQIFGATPDYYIFAQEKTSPFVPILYRVRPETIESGRLVYRAQLDLAKRCVEQNRWPGYADGRVVDMDLPSWAVADSQPVM